MYFEFPWKLIPPTVNWENQEIAGAGNGEDISLMEQSWTISVRISSPETFSFADAWYITIGLSRSTAFFDCGDATGEDIFQCLKRM